MSWDMSSTEEILGRNESIVTTTRMDKLEDGKNVPHGVLIAVALSVLGFTFLAALIIFWGLTRSEKADWGEQEKGRRFDVQQHPEESEEAAQERIAKEKELERIIDVVMPRDDAACRARIVQPDKKKIGQKEKEEWELLKKQYRTLVGKETRKEMNSTTLSTLKTSGTQMTSTLPSPSKTRNPVIRSRYH